MEEKKRGVILDVDGTLIDSNDLHAHAWVDAFAELGHDIAYARVRPLIGKGGDKVLDELLGIAEDSEQGKALTERRSEIFDERYLHQVKAFPRTREFVQTLLDHGYKVAVASSAEREQLEDLLDRALVKDLIPKTTSSSEAERSKPDPDIVEAAQRKLGIPPEQLVMVGDTPYDVEAASRAGIDTVALRCGGWSDKELHGAIAVYEDPADLNAHFAESPLGRLAPM